MPASPPRRTSRPWPEILAASSSRRKTCSRVRPTSAGGASREGCLICPMFASWATASLELTLPSPRRETRHAVDDEAPRPRRCPTPPTSAPLDWLASSQFYRILQIKCPGHTRLRYHCRADGPVQVPSLCYVRRLALPVRLVVEFSFIAGARGG